MTSVENKMRKAEPNKLDPRKIDSLYRAFENADFIVRKKYRSDMERYPICDVPESLKQMIQSINEEDNTRFSLGDNIQLFKIEKLVYDKKENISDKLTTVYHTMSSFENTSVIMLVVSDGTAIELYLGVAERDDGETIDFNARGNKLVTLKTSFEANFPGSTINEYDNDERFGKIGAVKRAFSQARAVSCVTGVASFRNKDLKSNEEFVQGMEKLFDAMYGKKFSAVFIADCKSNNEIEELCASYEDIYSELSPFAQSQQIIGRTNGVSDTDSFIEGVSDTTNESVSDTLSHSHTLGTAESHTNSGGVSLGIPVKIPFIKKKGILGINYSYSKSTSENESDTDTNSKTTTTGTAKSLTKQNSVAKTISSTTNDGLQINIQNRAVKTLMDRIDEQIKHLRACESFGVFDFSCYFLAQESSVSKAAASIYDSLMKGEDSDVEVSAVNTWVDEDAEKAIEYLSRFYHPLIAVPNLSKPQMNGNTPTGMYESLPVTPSTIISGKDISLHMGLPKKSILGIPVTECADFGRNVILLDNSAVEGIHLGNIFRMQKNENTPVELDLNSLAMHTFITGSTGSGKSNTVYQLLNQLMARNLSFMVIEPAKGEYKNVFGDVPGVHVYGTNPQYTELLRINPFRFANGIHILEHIDRLIEIFNVCWPMYAAMPAVLKNAVEQSYIDCGWDLTRSVNKSGRDKYPTFADVAENIRTVIDESEYDSENKGAYKGSLLTRLKSLTNGIYGMIFTCDDIDDAELFDEKVIVDLSRVGSSETKSLIMGMLVLKLQEHRLANSSGMNEKLKHVTVLEEAHTLLRRTSTEQSSESSNILGKSVEMLTNAIAEMRTYGEGFIIADQAPGLLDMAVIRNTNTKIILRLPDYNDRVLVGRAANLNDDQIDEIAKLPCGVAAVYQNDWVEPVLVKVNKCELKEKPYKFSGVVYGSEKYNTLEQLVGLLIKGRVHDETDYSVMDIEKGLKSLALTAENTKFVEEQLAEYKEHGSLELWSDEKFNLLSARLTDILGVRKKVEKCVLSAEDNDELTNMLSKIVLQIFPDASYKEIRTLSHCFMEDMSRQQGENVTRRHLYLEWAEHIKEGGVK